MIMNKPTSIDAVVRTHMCTGCGACAGLAPNLFRMEDNPQTGRRPVRLEGMADAAGERMALAVCPGAGAGPKPAVAPGKRTPAGAPNSEEWGSVLEIWEGHATDPQIRWRGSSGGAVTALAAYALESGAAGGVVHVRQSTTNALLNESTISRNEQELLAAAGSRYAPASPCDQLGNIAASSSPLVFIGKPCDVQAASAAAAREPLIARNIALTISIFCAGAPSSNATRALLKSLGVPADAKVTGIRYRGEGWPGEMAATYLTASGEQHSTRSISYEEGWGDILQKHRQWRCQLCADHIGEFADISVGDPWDKPRDGSDLRGSSLIVVRSERGRAFLRNAIAAGFIAASPRPLTSQAEAQPNLARTRHILFGRLIGLRILGLTAPSYSGWKLEALWFRHTTFHDKLVSVLGTIRRAFRRKLWQSEAQINN
jgi:coenzyme F420 hydrogenase subunit beta